MTIADYIKKLDNKIAEINSGKWLSLAAIDTHDAMSERIFVDNENVSGETFQYSTSTKIRKSKKGKPTNRVTFKDTNDLQLDFNNSFGKPKPTKVNVFKYKINLKRERNVRVSKALDKRYSFVFKIKESEKDVFLQSAVFNLKLILKK